MKRKPCLAASLPLVLSIAWAEPSQTAGDRKGIEARLEQVRAAFERKRFDDLPNLCTEDCKFKMETGQWIGVREMVAQLKVYMGPMQNLRIKSKTARVAIKRNRAEVRLNQTTTGTVVVPPDKVKHTIRAIETLHYVLTKGPKGWLLTRWDSVSGKSYVDGKEQK